MKLFFSTNRIDYFFPRLLIFTIVFYFLKTAFWPLTYLFIFGYTILVILFLIRYDWKFKFSNFFLDFRPPIILAGILLLAFLFSGQFSNVVLQKDILLLVILFSLFYFLFWNKAFLEQEIPKSFAFNLVIITITVISVLNFVNEIFNSVMPAEALNKLNISEGMTLANDYNFFSLFILFGLVIINYKNKNDDFQNKYPKLVTFSLNFIFIINVILSGSRRGIVVLFVLFLIYAAHGIILGIKNFNTKSFLKNSLIILVIGILFCFIGEKIYQRIPTERIARVVFSYASLFGVSDYVYVDRLLSKRNPQVPEDKKYLIDKYSFNRCPEYWGTIANGTTLSIVKTTFGNEIKVFRESGDQGGFSLYYDGPKILYLANHTYKISFKIKFLRGNFNSFNVGFWGDDGGKGKSYAVSLEKEIESIGDGWYNCTSEYTFINNHIGIVGFINSVKDQSEFIISDFELTDLDYDSSLPRFLFEVKNKGDAERWLNKINPPLYGDSNLIINGSFMYGLKFWKYSADFLTINIEKSNTESYARISRGNGDGGHWSLYYAGRNIEFKENNEYQIAFKMKPLIPKSIPFMVGFWVDEGEGHGKAGNLKLHIDSLENGWLLVKANYKFRYNHNNLIFPINCQIDNSQFYITDISLTNLTQPQFNVKPNYQVTDTAKKENLFSGRTTRWLYARELWKTEYQWYNKLLGHGFDYLEWYGQKFYKDQIRYDWPHNPFITILLYSGILGLIFYLWFLYRVIKIYVIYRKKYKSIFIGFLITFFFSFFSAGNPFDPPVMGFFVMLPFLIDYIHKKDISN